MPADIIRIFLSYHKHTLADINSLEMYSIIPELTEQRVIYKYFLTFYYMIVDI